MAISRKKIALLHIAAQQVGLTEAEYRGLLASVGVSSSVQLSEGQFDTIMAHLKRAGFVYRKPKGNPTPSKKKLLKKLDAQLAALDLKRGYADGIARAMFGIDCVHWCTAAQLHKIVAAMAYHGRRRRQRSV